MSVRWIEPPKHSYIPLLASYQKIAPPSEQRFTDRCIRWVHSPDTIEELIQIENFFDLLCSGIVFFHNRKPSVNELIFNRLNAALTHCEVLRFMSDRFKFSDYRDGSWLSRRDTDKWPILIIDSSDGATIKDFAYQMSDKPVSHECGIWIRGYIDELETFIPSLFHALFLFDTSTQELEILRRRIALSESMISSLRSQQTDFAFDESAIFFWNYEKEPYAPLIDINPKVLGVGRKAGLSALPKAKLSASFFVEGGITMTEGDTINISGGQVGAVGSRAHAHDMTFTQIGNQIEKTVDLTQLADELARLRQEMRKKATEAEQDIAVSDIAKAEQAARAKNASKVAEYLKSAGRWALDVATKIGVALAAEALKQAMGLK